MRLLLDEQFAPALAAELRREGRDAVAATERPALTGASDTALLAWAAADGRTLVTAAVADMLAAHRELLAQGAGHAGIVLVEHPEAQRDGRRLIRALELATDAAGVEAAQVLWL